MQIKHCLGRNELFYLFIYWKRKFWNQSSKLYLNLGKEEQIKLKESRRKETKTRTETWNKEIGQKIKKINETKSWLLLRTNKIVKKKLRAVLIMNIKLGIKQ